MTFLPGATRERRIGYAAWITICLVWGTTYLAIRVALETLPVALLAGFRWLIAGLVLSALLPFLGERLPQRQHWGPITIVAFLMNIIGNGCVVWAQQHVASGLTAVIVACVPFWMVFIEMVSGGDRLTRRTLAGLLIGFGGIVVLVWPQVSFSTASGRMFAAGVLALQVANIGWSLGTAYTKRRAIPASPLSASALQMLIAGVMFMAVGSMAGEWSRVSFNARSVAAVLYLALAGSVIGYSAYVYALRYLSVSTVSLYAYVNPIIAVALGSLLLGEPFSARIVVAAVLVFSGVALMKWKKTMRLVAPAARKAVA